MVIVSLEDFGRRMLPMPIRMDARLWTSTRNHYGRKWTLSGFSPQFTCDGHNNNVHPQHHYCFDTFGFQYRPDETTTIYSFSSPCEKEDCENNSTTSSTATIVINHESGGTTLRSEHD
jgi:hypothetical protein